MSDTAKILVVDDDPQVRAPLGAHLRHQGYAVIEAATTSETFQQARYERPDLIVLRHPPAGHRRDLDPESSVGGIPKREPPC